MLFIESSSFTKTIYNYLTDEGYKDFQTKLVEQPHLGAVIPGCGGIRKIRWPHKIKSHGKRGGLRIYYLYLEDISCIYFLAIIEKGQREDLSHSEKKILKDLALQFKKSARLRRLS